ncbi:DUF4184 family protein [Kribbella sp. CA-293567]|uniref:DUF4184 family protein n=1 Tax=Kribbella sp. CA-293567 TaxID=3002436 RepID=UPI0022DD25A5|nr:DUF4184 family protein [Kribbella sp. CA-293567]WBQ02635.1 DUF4184 family protein [Kribbella sp. CA-293567]
MPFTLAHPAAVLPLLRHPFVPAALLAGAMAPDVPYFVDTLGPTTSAGDWYEPFLNATHSHTLTGVPIALLYAVALVIAYRLLRAPLTALLPAGLALPTSARRALVSYLPWFALSALIGIATHLAWDALTDAEVVPAARLLQHASTAFGLATVGWFLWTRRGRLRRPDDKTHHLGPTMRRVAITLLIAAPLLGAAALAHDDYTDFRTVTVVDYDHPVIVDEGNGVISTSYPTSTVPASWTSLAEGVLTGAAKRAGAAAAIALLLYAAGWQVATAVR